MNKPLLSLPPGMVRLLPNRWDGLALLIVLALFLFFSTFSADIFNPITLLDQQPIDLSPWHLFDYGIRTSLRMILALGLSLAFTFAYGALAAKSAYLGRILVPLLDILQSVPILGFVSMTTIFFLSLVPGKIIGLELTAIFAIFTSQAWNMTFSFYQSLRSVPSELKEAARNLQLSGWMQFWRLEVPIALPPLIWNIMVSFSGGWFFIVASEAIHLGDYAFRLPGIGSYIALAIEKQDVKAIGWAILAMAAIIIIFDQLLFRPLLVWSARFRLDGGNEEELPHSWVLHMLRHSHLDQILSKFKNIFLHPIPWRQGDVRKNPPMPMSLSKMTHGGLLGPIGSSRLMEYLLFFALLGITAFGIFRAGQDMPYSLLQSQAYSLLTASLATTARVVVMIVLISLLWVPIGIWIGLHPKIANNFQFVTQLLSAFPANLLFPLAIGAIISLQLNPEIWLSPLLIFGAQWYILFNVIAGTYNIPTELHHIAKSFHINGWLRWKKTILPAIAPYYLTGAVTATGGAWNASIVAEFVRWGDQTISVHGLGAYIAEATIAGDQQRVLLGVALMCLIVVGFNRLIWRPLYNYAEKKFQMALQ